MVCAEDANGNNDCSAVHVNYESSWMSSGNLYKKRAPGYIKTGSTGGTRDMAAFSYACPSGEDCTNVASVVNETTGAILITAANLAPNTVYAVCPGVDLGLCDKRLLKGGLVHDRWDMTDEGAGTFLTIIALISLCSCLFCVVYFLQIIVKGPAARMLRAVVGFNGYLNIVIGMGITILVQSSSITTSTLTPLAAVGLITLEDMLPLTLGANIGTTLTGVMAATVVTSNPVQAWQVALCHPLLQHLRYRRLVPYPPRPPDSAQRCSLPGQDDRQPEVRQGLPPHLYLRGFLHHPRHRVRHCRRRRRVNPRRRVTQTLCSRSNSILYRPGCISFPRRAFVHETIRYSLCSSRVRPLRTDLDVHDGSALRQPASSATRVEGPKFLKNVKPVVAQLREIIATTRRGSRGARAQPPAPTTEAERVRVSRRWWERTTLPR